MRIDYTKTKMKVMQPYHVLSTAMNYMSKSLAAL